MPPARREYLQGEVLLRAHRETMPANPAGRAWLEEYLDQLADRIRRKYSDRAVRVIQSVPFTGFGLGTLDTPHRRRCR